jgi:hypothetical protein
MNPRKQVEQLSRLGSFLALGLTLVLMLGGFVTLAASSEASGALVWFALACLAAVLAVGNYSLWKRSRKRRK